MENCQNRDLKLKMTPLRSDQSRKFRKQIQKIKILEKVRRSFSSIFKLWENKTGFEIRKTPIHTLSKDCLQPIRMENVPSTSVDSQQQSK